MPHQARTGVIDRAITGGSALNVRAMFDDRRFQINRIIGDHLDDGSPLTESDVDAINRLIAEYFAAHWRDDDNPEIECKMRRSWPVLCQMG